MNHRSFRPRTIAVPCAAALAIFGRRSHFHGLAEECEKIGRRICCVCIALCVRQGVISNKLPEHSTNLP
jgi:hypothetical protein